MIRVLHVARAALAGPLALAAAALLAGGGPAAAEVTTLDQGALVVSQQGKTARVEEFSMDQNGDTLVVRAQSRVAAGPRADQPPDKVMSLEVGALDFTLVRYASQQVLGPDTLKRGIETTPGDTTCMIYRELNNHGVGDRVAMPPGRLYVLDPPLFTTFNFIARSLQGQTFESRPIGVLVLGTPDTFVVATITDQGAESIRWGSRPVAARKWLIADQATRFTIWVAPDGRLLRLRQADAGILVERRAPPVKRHAPAPKRPGGPAR